MKNYLELEIKIIYLLQEDIVTTSLPGDGDVTDDPYTSAGGGNWWD